MLPDLTQRVSMASSRVAKTNLKIISKSAPRVVHSSCTYLGDFTSLVTRLHGRTNEWTKSGLPLVSTSGASFHSRSDKRSHQHELGTLRVKVTMYEWSPWYIWVFRACLLCLWFYYQYESCRRLNYKQKRFPEMKLRKNIVYAPYNWSVHWILSTVSYSDITFLLAFFRNISVSIIHHTL